MTALPTEIDPGESLGRAVFDNARARKAAAGKIHSRIFREKDHVPDLSVDRLSFGALDQIARLHDSARGANCLGWACVQGSAAANRSRRTVSDPIPGNDYHALIVLPHAPEDEFVAQQQEHAVELALAAIWMPRPTE